MTLSERTVELAVTAARMATESPDPIKFICEVGYMPLALLHDMMVKEKQIIGLREIGSDQKLKYWTLACIGRPEGSRVKRIWISQAIYLYELIKIENGNT